MVVNPKTRYTAKQALQHVFIKSNCNPAQEPLKTSTILTPLRAVLTASAETTVHPVTATADTALDKTQPPVKTPSNLAQRVSANLRSRGMSTSRRRSADVTAARRRSMDAHAPPPPAPAPTKPAYKIQEEEESENIPIGACHIIFLDFQ